ILTLVIAGSIVVLVMLNPGSSNAQSAAKTSPAKATASKPWVAPKTPWSDPDLQGTWTSDDTWGVPMERPAQYGDRRYLTEQELGQREKQVQAMQQRLLNPGDNHSPAKAQLDAIAAGKEGPPPRGGFGCGVDADPVSVCWVEA